MLAKSIPVVLDTDIGTDIDDTWALAMLLRSPELDLRLVTTVSGDTTYRAKLAARLLEVGGHGDVPVGIGRPGGGLVGTPQGSFVEGFELEAHAAPVHSDGVGAMIDTILGCEEPVALVSIGPLGNVAEALEREPRIAENARLIGMHGSLRRGYRGSDEPAAEYNVACDVEAARRAFAAPWPVTLTPLDSCGIVYLQGDLYQRVLGCDDPLVRALLENYRSWLDATSAKPGQLERRSTTLYDTVAVYLAFAEDLLEIEELGVHVDDRGFTRIDASGRPLRIASEWRDLDRFHRLIVERQTGTP
jgi:inosine-uridine nucleoside N-ribohydrolase